MFDFTNTPPHLNVFKDLEFPRLISYPRTGSHWFRILMEAYLDEPSLVQAFFNPQPTKFWGFHIHHRWIDEPDKSEGPIIGLQNAIYLYRDPVDTIFSQLKYHGEIEPGWNGDYSVAISKGMEKYKHEYYKHMQFYRTNKPKISNLHFVRYESLKEQPARTFKSCTDFLNRPWKPDRFDKIYKLCDKKLTKALTPHDPSALNIEEIVDPALVKIQKEKFQTYYAKEIYEMFRGVL